MGRYADSSKAKGKVAKQFKDDLSILYKVLFADDVTPPPEAVQWSPVEGRAFFERGGGAWRPVRPWSDLSTVGTDAAQQALPQWMHPKPAR